MKRLIKENNRPRERKKSVQFLLSLELDVDNFHGDAIDDLEKFKQWVANTFTQWDKSILEYFLYSHNLLQNPDNDKYFLDFKVEGILKDDTQTDIRPQVEENLLKELKEDEKDKKKKDNKKNKGKQTNKK